MKAWKNYWVWIVAVFLVGLFWWLRFNNIGTSLFYFNDMGRDLLVLQDWMETGKPPLLGPQTSSLPINQSAIYFYLLMPGFLLFNGSPMALLYTNAFIYISFFLGGLWFLRGNKKMQMALLGFFLLVTISPQYIIQSRFVWNPSFTTPLLATALISFYLLTQKFSQKLMIVFVATLAIAISFSYSMAPAFIGIFIFLVLFWKTNRLKTVLAEMLALIVVNLPTIAFELKHQFLLTSSLFTRGVTPQQAENISMTAKFSSLFGYGLAINRELLIGAILILAAILLWYGRKKENPELNFFSKLLFLTVLITFIVPLTIHSHYIFGFTTLLFLCIASLPRWPKILVLLVLSSFYLTPSRLSAYFKPAIRTYEQMTQCFDTVCKEIKEPIFESVQAGFHPYHNGPEHRVMMKQAGCQVKYIENEPSSASLMAVVLDNSTFELGKTSYNELTLFGKAKEIKRYNCQENFQVVVLEKDQAMK
ncbi:hypothetical protein A3K29_02970 [Candidatus Collierbacteria bacterium RIFOXYB2_FULL_46_14]|uniref:Glycosyltransferase RgtA/B/C/D-like domain-containing protein n=1 Tax=Candidatus Collierbacteria bacterium GW2011_GWA2_46_26 TaxID=1618381 RepID=A0A0G1PM23_9BACT|nr:MAG: hypothetical protein UW29_C0004G0100 [Candidatus Collierbacteria bacterium GW2011_GWC2_44_13]KKU33849.1 MAG: hypothetical protein UX47_C0001G0132 [Candidatus Collierbacteria bacterium GW2011_GWA2_46_26]OGD73082.1 MAG: hypothetical protein A3K29_02970 [Candidatus Collierbacteria bacterium RIFOXYB2_FULL_46_14]OGD76124.1 MAG: hypothetical protein A3K43_02970 [Candidatus Collierbacteria bacterium RIFOXYA2_FULL_46_20]OGD77460.1 MAG: hypothetical protein A3K39_02970 [Candidatus Collierbacteri